jgi:peptidyl-prolyl cis-trans isomerase D
MVKRGTRFPSFPPLKNKDAGPMLRGLRNASSTWIGKAVMATVMGLLIFAFGIWGINDIFRGFGRSTVAKVGHTEIGLEQFRQLYNDRLQQIGRQFGKPLTPEQARAFGLDRNVLQQAIAEAALDEATAQLGLGQSDQAVIDTISHDPNFAGANGKFDAQRFTEILREFGFTEARYIAEQRRTMLRRELATTISSGIEPPLALLDVKNRYDNETRTVDLVRLAEAQAGPIEQPSPEALASYFEENKARFRAPEYRKLSFVVLSPEAQAKWIDVSDDDAKKVFEVNKSRFGTPEKRQVQQMVFPSTEEAKAARDKIDGGESFDDLAKERGLKPSDYDIGLVTRTGIIDPTVADAIFALPENQISQPIQGRFGAVIARVTKIEPGNEPSYEAVAGTIKRQIALDRARATIQGLQNKMEDERSGGASIAEAAQKIGVQSITIDAIDRSGRDAQGQQVSGLPPGGDLVSAAFNSDVGVDNDPIQAGSGFVWYEVLGITPSRERTLEEVHDQVATRWHNDQVANKLRAKADDMVDQLTKGGKKLAEVADTIGVKLETVSAFKRGSTPPNVAGNVIDGAFRLTKGDSDRTTGDQPNEWIVYTLTGITTPTLDPNAAETKTMRDTIQRAQGDEQIGAYIAKRESETGVKINEEAFAIATGASQPDN